MRTSGYTFLVVGQPTPAGLRELLGDHMPERLPPMTEEQIAEQQAAFDRTAAHEGAQP